VKRSKAEETISGFDCYARALAAVPLEEIADDAAVTPEDATPRTRHMIAVTATDRHRLDGREACDASWARFVEAAR
jgi:hypothetical protein